jgi:chemosensory pili system protein ChpA (sensor histidine kinase/response regulator)
VITDLEFVSDQFITEPLDSVDIEEPQVINLEDDGLLKENLAIFLEEAEDHLATIDQFLINDRPTNDNYNTLIRALYTLRGSSAMAHVDHVFEASSKLKTYLKHYYKKSWISSDETALLTHYAQFVRDYLHTLKHEGSEQKFVKFMTPLMWHGIATISN